MEMMPGFSSANVRTLVEDTLRLFVGQGKRLSWTDLAAATGDKERKLRSYVEADGPDMPMDVFMRVFTVLPPEAFGRFAQRMGFSAAALDLCPEATVLRAMAKASRLVADGNEALEDGRITPRERAQIAARAAELLPTLAVLAEGRDHG